MKRYVFDTSALFCFIENEAGAPTVEGLLKEAIDGKAVIFISAASLIELFYISAQQQGIEKAQEHIRLVRELPLTIVEISAGQTEAIGLLKAKYQISFADSCIAGLAQIEKAELVHKDPEYEPLPIKQKRLPYKK